MARTSVVAGRARKERLRISPTPGFTAPLTGALKGESSAGCVVGLWDMGSRRESAERGVYLRGSLRLHVWTHAREDPQRDHHIGRVYYGQ